jgi:hypothetical protein
VVLIDNSDLGDAGPRANLADDVATVRVKIVVE